MQINEPLGRDCTTREKKTAIKTPRRISRRNELMRFTVVLSDGRGRNQDTNLLSDILGAALDVCTGFSANSDSAWQVNGLQRGGESIDGHGGFSGAEILIHTPMSETARWPT